MIGKILSFVVLIVIMVLGVLLGILNPASVSFDYYFDQRHIPLSILLTFSFVFGLLLAGLFVIMQVIQLKWSNHKLGKLIKKQSNEIIELKKKIHTEQEKSVTTELIVSPVKPD